MVQTPTKPLTLDEFLKRPETKPASQFINGQIIEKPMPKENTAQFKAIWLLTFTGYSNPNASPAPIQNCAVPLVVDRLYPIWQSLPGNAFPATKTAK
jgi:Uma2 family endonuclease